MDQLFFTPGHTNGASGKTSDDKIIDKQGADNLLVTLKG